MKLCTPYSCATTSLNRAQPFEALFRRSFANAPSLAQLFASGESPSASRNLRLATDLFEDADHYFARFEIPGVKKEDIAIELLDRELTVTARKTLRSDEGEQAFTLTRSLSMPVGISSEVISAKLEDGVLTLTLPKPAEQKPRAITIE